MNRIEKKFAELKEKNRKALITFITAGDPDLETTVRLVEAMESQGADLIELGIPYSDPVAEGPVIQGANRRALKNKVKIRDIMEMVAGIRKSSSIPLLYLLYFNCILQYGPGRFFSDCEKAGIDGVIIPDLPYEEKWEIKDIALEHSVDILSLISPASGKRIENIAKDARGFLYCVSSLGVTGMRDTFSTNFKEFLSYAGRFTKIPKAIGFGISTAEHVRQLKEYCDGLIVGSAVVKQVEMAKSQAEAVLNVSNYVRMLREALDDDGNTCN